MIHLNQPPHSPRRSATHHLRKLLLLPVAGAAMGLSSCKEDVPAPPVSYVTDTAPVGAGLSVIGFALLGAAVVGVLGRMLK
jgi:hypothetical protein